MDLSIPMTRHGAERLQAELKQLLHEDRPKIVQAITEARAHGDLKENAEYHAAKEKQAFIEGRISELTEKLSRIRIVEQRPLDQGVVHFGASVSLLDENGQAFRYTIVGEEEADIKSGLISFRSPIASHLIGKRAGDVVSVQTPAGIVQYDIESVEYL